MAANPLRAESVRFNPAIPADRQLVEGLIEQLVELLDMVDGDPDAEDGDEDCCAAYDDRVGHNLTSALALHELGPGDIDDEEDNGDREYDSEREPEEPLIPSYGLDQCQTLPWTHGLAPEPNFPCCGVLSERTLAEN